MPWQPTMPHFHPSFLCWPASCLKVVTIICNQDQLHISKPRDTASTGNSSWMVVYLRMALQYMEHVRLQEIESKGFHICNYWDLCACSINKETGRWFRKGPEKTITSQQGQQRSRERYSSQASENVWTNQEAQKHQPGTRKKCKSHIEKVTSLIICATLIIVWAMWIICVTIRAFGLNLKY